MERKSIAPYAAIFIPNDVEERLRTTLLAVANDLTEIRQSLYGLLLDEAIGRFTAHSDDQKTTVYLKQLATGNVPGAHLNFDDKAGSPPSPNVGDLWRSGDSLFFRQAAATVDLAAGGGGGNKYQVITGDTGTANAGSVSDTLNIKSAGASSGLKTTAADASPDTLTIEYDVGSMGTEKASPVSADRLLLYDSVAADHKFVTIANLPGGAGGGDSFMEWAGL